MGSTVVARKIRKSFATGRRGRRRVTEVLKGVDLSVEVGEMVSIVGPSGSGKSTLLYCLSGLEAADEGSIEVMGRQVVHARRSVLAKIRSGHVGFVFQSYNLIPSLSVGDNVSLPARLAGRPMSARQTRAALESVGLAGRERDRPGDLSGGEQQRVGHRAGARGRRRRGVRRRADGRVGFAKRPRGSTDAAQHRRRPATLGGDGDP